MDALHLTPLWSADHLPLKGGDWLAGMLCIAASYGDDGNHTRRLISPLEGEMVGRPEGGRRAPASPKKCIP